MTARLDLAADLADAFPLGLGVKVTDAPDGTSPEPGVDLITVGVDRIEPGLTLAATRSVTLEVIIAVAETTPGPADEQLDAFLEAVLDVLDTHPWAVWTSAKRALYLDAFPAYVITVTKES